jgi:hypothetical protein
MWQCIEGVMMDWRGCPVNNYGIGRVALSWISYEQCKITLYLLE